MTQSWREAASAAMDLLLKLAEEHAQPERAQAAIAALRALHPGTTMDLAWERNVPAEAGVHYDVLIDVGDRGTMSLAFCADRGVPWPLRGAQPWSDGQLLRVDGTTMYVGQAIEFLDMIWREERLATRLIDACIVRAQLAKTPVAVSDDELQAASEAFRREHGLLSARDTEEWLSARGMDEERLGLLMEDRVLEEKLRRLLVGGQLEGQALDDAQRVQAERDLFAAWLAEARKKARIEWNWGRSAR